ncbi:MAG: hypothetical protein WB626_03720 [Bacteroidota bacterium]
MKSRCGFAGMLCLALVPGLLLDPGCRLSHRSREQETREFVRLADEILPAVADLTGFPAGGGVPIKMQTRRELREFLQETVELDYPDGHLRKIGRTLSAMGFFPAQYDLEAGLIQLVEEQAGALYDPRGKVLVGLLEMPAGAGGASARRIILAHELTHALQDRAVDIVSHMKVGLENADYEYAFRSTIEGMASVVMLAHLRKQEVRAVGDVGTFMRSSFEQSGGNPAMQALARTPVYIRELLISPYAEGGAFVERWLAANPGKDLAALMEAPPLSSEQVLHYGKYAERDTPAVVDLSGVSTVLPEGWSPLYANMLGEFDVRVLCRLFPETTPRADAIAEGWDGIRFVSFTDRREQLLIAGSSVWDSAGDAEEFSDALSAILALAREAKDFRVVRQGARVHFVIGDPGGAISEKILAVLTRAGKGDGAPRG